MDKSVLQQPIHSLIPKELNTRFVSTAIVRITNSGAPYPYRKEKVTHELIFSWLSRLAVLLVGVYARRRAAELPKMAAIL